MSTPNYTVDDMSTPNNTVDDMSTPDYTASGWHVNYRFGYASSHNHSALISEPV